MKKTAYGFHVLSVLVAGVLLSHTVRSSDVNGAISFTANTTAKASEVNANFNAVISAVNDNHARITALESNTNLTKCPPDMVPNGPGCIDKYEASVWETMDTALITKIRTGAATKADLTAAGTQRGVVDDYDPGCPDTANGCKTFYAASVADVVPARHPTWFQALAACRNAGKRLPTNQEWQMAAFGTPDPGAVSATQCNVGGGTASLANTGARSACVSDIGAYDMVGNMWEWVADWMQGGVASWAPTGSGAVGALSVSNSTTYGNDLSVHIQPALSQGSGVNFPAALFRGGSYPDTAGPAGVFAIYAVWAPSQTGDNVGFRCAK